MLASVAQSDARPTGGCGFDPCWVRQHSFMEIAHEIFSSVILFLRLIQKGQLSVSDKGMCTSTGLPLKRTKPAQEKYGSVN